MTKYYLELVKELASSFVRSRRGNVALMFGFILTPVLVFAGAAIDYSRAQNALYTLQTAIDAAALAGASLENAEPSEREAEAKAIYALNIAGRPDLADTQVSVSVVDNSVIARVNYDVPTTITMLAGIDIIGVGAQSVAAFVTASEPLDIYFVFDQSESMNIADTPADMDALIAATSHVDFWGRSGCAFACHNPEPWQRPERGLSLYEFAQREGIPLRYDKIKTVIGQTSEDVLNSVTDDSVRVGMYAFSSSARKVVDPTTDYEDIDTALQNLSIPSTYSRFSRAFPDIANGIRRQRSADNAQKALVLMTDGVETIFSVPFYNGGPISAETCNVFKNVVDTVYVLHVEYPRPEYLAQFAYRVEPHYDTIADALRDCATSPEHYFVATNSQEMIANLRRIAERVLSNVNVRLSG